MISTLKIDFNDNNDAISCTKFRLIGGFSKNILFNIDETISLVYSHTYRPYYYFEL